MGLFGCWHKWGKWSSPTNGILEKSGTQTGYFKTIQLRECEKCGLAEIRALPQLRHIEEFKKDKGVS